MVTDKLTVIQKSLVNAVGLLLYNDADMGPDPLTVGKEAARAGVSSVDHGPLKLAAKPPEACQSRGATIKKL